MRYAHVPVKQAVISPSALSLMYPAEGIPGYPREQFIDDLLRRARDGGSPVPATRAHTRSRSISPKGDWR